MLVLLFFAFVVASIIGFVIGRKSSLAVARREEIKRLMAFAAGEAAIAELGASAEYVVSSAFSPVPVSTTYHHQCAVCYSSTTTRCSRCKAVWYCSGRCQIIHWRQGHRDYCHPSSEALSNVERKIPKQDSDEIKGVNFETEGGQHTTPIQAPRRQPVATTSHPLKPSDACLLSSAEGCGLSEASVNGRDTDKGLFPYELFVKLYTRNKLELQPFGLINCGNSCYANAVLQCLAFTPPLNAYFLRGLHSKTCVHNKEGCFNCEFEGLILKAKEGKSPLSPIGILSQLKNVGNGKEEDAHEFLRYAVDTMQSICLREGRSHASGCLEEEEITLIGLTFGGYLRSTIKCTKCRGKSERQERMMDLTVEIGGKTGTLEEALQQFTGTEILDGGNKYQCSRCKSYEKAKKKLTIMEAPNILTIALKRFQSGNFEKLNKPIQFPDILDLAPFMSGTSDTSPVYKLYGVVVHLDSMNGFFSGHYICFVKNLQNKWFKVDDSIVTPVERERVFSNGAYMLLYARCSPRAPRLIRNRIISSNSQNKAITSWRTGRKAASKLRSFSANLPRSIPQPPASCVNFEPFYPRYTQLQRIPEEDSSSDNCSLFSSVSDEGSCRTDSTSDSGEAGRTYIQ